MYSQLKLNIDRNNKKMKNFDPETTKNCPKVPKSAGVYMAYHTILDLRAPSAEAHGIFAAKLRARHAIWWFRSHELPQSELPDPF